MGKCDDLQMLKFGQLIDLQLLDKGMVKDKGEEEMNNKLEVIDAANERELAKLERKHRGLKESLLAVTQENTSLLSRIADLSAKQFSLEKDLNTGGNSVAVADAGPAVRNEIEERNRLVSLVKLQAKEVDALKAEINLLRRKGGHIYISDRPTAQDQQYNESSSTPMPPPPAPPMAE
jgi:predicted phage gp36 major capsid-like protein